MTTTLKADEIEFDLSKSLIKLILDVINIYKEMVFMASVKQKIMRIILDKEFLKTNLLHLESANVESEKEKKILNLFKESKFEDYTLTDINF